MSSIVIQGDTSGSITIQAPAISGSTVINLPTVTGAGGSFLVSDSNGSITFGNSVGIGTGASTPRGRLDVVSPAGSYSLDSITFGPGTLTYPTPQYNGWGSIVSKGTTSDARLMIQDGNGRINNYWNTYSDAGGYKYIVSGEPAARDQMSIVGTTGADFGWYSAPAGTSGGSLSFTQIARMAGGTGGFTWFSPRGTSSDFYIDAVSNVMVGYTSTTSQASNSLLVAGNVGIGTNAPGYKLDMSVSVGASAIANVARFYADASASAEARIIFGTFANAINGAIGVQSDSATTGILKFYTSTSGVLSEKMRIDGASGTVGIGTVSPSSLRVTIEGSGSQLRIRNTTTRYRSDYIVSNAGSTNINSYDDTGAAYTAINFDTSAFTVSTGISTNTERMRIDSSGNVMIGATSSIWNEKLTLSLGASTPNANVGLGIYHSAGSGYTGSLIRVQTETIGTGWKMFEGRGQGGGVLYWVDGTGAGYFAGNVGIGTASTVAQLGVYGAGQTTSNILTSSGLGGTLYVRDSGGGGGNGGVVLFGAQQGSFAAIKGFLTDNASNSRGDLVVSFRNANTDTALTERIRVLSDGTLLLRGGSIPTISAYDAPFIFRIAGGGLGLGGSYETGGTSPIVLYTQGTERMRIDSAGSVGIGIGALSFSTQVTPSLTMYGGNTGLCLRNATTGTGNNTGTDIFLGTGGDLNIDQRSAQPIYFQTTATTRMAITASGDVGIGIAAPSKKFEVYTSANSLQIGAIVRNDQAGTGVAAIGFNVSSPATSDASVTKAGIGLVRNGTFGRGTLTFYNDQSAANNDFTTANAVMSIDNSGIAYVGGTSTQTGATGTIYSRTTARAYANFGANTSATVVRDSFNCSSITYSAAGKFAVAFSSALVDANYTCKGSCASDTQGFFAGTSFHSLQSVVVPPTSSGFTMFTSVSGVNGGFNPTYVFFTVYR